MIELSDLIDMFKSFWEAIEEAAEVAVFWYVLLLVVKFFEACGSELALPLLLRL